MAREALKNFEGFCPVNKIPMSFSVTYVEQEDGSWVRRDYRDCQFRGLFNPQGCKDKKNCELLSSVQDTYPAEEFQNNVVEEYKLFEKLAALNENK